jgi:hypothetical protein
MKVTAWAPAAGLAVLLAACGASGQAPLAVMRTATHGDDGQVIGTFDRVGGPLGLGGKQPPTIRLMGTVQFTSAQRGMVAVRVGKSGRFSVWLPAGAYQVSGRSPSIIEVLPTGAQRVTTCSPAVPVTVVPHRTARIAVVCPVP